MTWSRAWSERQRDKVWAYLTDHPNASIMEISLETGRSLHAVRGYLKSLHEQGVIEQTPFKRRQRRVVVPFTGKVD